MIQSETHDNILKTANHRCAWFVLCSARVEKPLLSQQVVRKGGGYRSPEHFQNTFLARYKVVCSHMFDVGSEERQGGIFFNLHVIGKPGLSTGCDDILWRVALAIDNHLQLVLLTSAILISAISLRTSSTLRACLIFRSRILAQLNTANPQRENFTFLSVASMLVR
jgi:hypothetical protein